MANNGIPKIIAAIDKTPLQEAFDYLRAETIDAHLAGDGMKVLHLCSIALERIGSRSRTSREEIDLEAVRWAFFLGLYWMVDDWLTYVIEGALKLVRHDGNSAWDMKLIRFLLTTLHIPVNFDSVDDLKAASPDWLSQRSREVEDLAALGLAVEIAWYEDPRNVDWKELAEAWLSNCPKPSPLETEVRRLALRLELQATFCSEGKLPDGNAHSVVISGEQEFLLRAWKLYYQAEFSELDKLIRELAAIVKVDSPVFPAYFHVVHWSRIQRRSKESQFTSLSRLTFIESRQPSQGCQQLRDERFESNSAEVGRRGFPDGVASERFTCFRIAMLNQLHSLRSWDIGGWLLGERQRAFSLLELGARGDVQFAKAGIIAQRNTLFFPERGKLPQLDRSVQLLDVLPENDRRDVVKDLLASPRIAWVAAHRVLEELSDAIPDDVIADVAARYVQLDLDPFHTVGGHTFLKMWGDLLYRSNRAVELIEVLKPALLVKAARPMCWDDLHGTLCGAILKGASETALSILDTFIGTSCEEVHWNQYRFSILCIVGRSRPEFSDQCLDWLKRYAEAKQNQFDLFRIRHIHALDRRPVDDKVFRDWVRASVLANCEKCLAETGPRFTLGMQQYHGMMLKLTWPKAETAMITKLIAVINAEYVPLLNKGDALACLAVLASHSSPRQVKVITRNAMNWLDHGIVGKNLDSVGPLSTGQFSGMGKDAIVPGFAFLLGTLAEKHCDSVGPKLARWIMVNGVRQSASVVNHTIRTALYLSIGLKEPDEAVSIALVGIAEATAHVCFPHSPEKTIDGFRSVVLDESSSAVSDWRNSTAGKICLEMWQQRLIEASRLPSPRAREAAAYAIKKWEYAGLPMTDEMQNACNRLLSDCRYRVRAALS